MDEKKQKQIEEMAVEFAKINCNPKGCYSCNLCDEYGSLELNCEDYLYYRTMAETFYNAGYRKQSEWISVGERLPDIELHKAKAVVPDVLFPCLVVREGNIVSYIEKAWYWGVKFTTQDCTDITDSITHWMPLPEPPKMKGGAE